MGTGEVDGAGVDLGVGEGAGYGIRGINVGGGGKGGKGRGGGGGGGSGNDSFPPAYIPLANIVTRIEMIGIMHLISFALIVY